MFTKVRSRKTQKCSTITLTLTLQIITQHKDTKTRRFYKNLRKPLFCKASVLCTAVSKALHLHPASKLASADELLSTAFQACLYRKEKYIENRGFNLNVNPNPNLSLET